jgi:hypothetical protein
LYWDQKTKTCKDQATADCGGFKPAPSAPFICPGTGLFAHPKDCRKYYSCPTAGGNGVELHCSPTLYFDHKTQSCTNAAVADCGGYKPTPAPLLRPAICELICEMQRNPSLAPRTVGRSENRTVESEKVEKQLGSVEAENSTDIEIANRGFIKWPQYKPFVSYRPVAQTKPQQQAVVIDKPGVVSKPIIVKPGDRPTITISPQIALGSGIAAGTQMLLSLLCVC